MCYSFLVFADKLLDDGYSVSFNSNLVIIGRNRLTICTRNSENNLYVLRPLSHRSLFNVKMFKVENPKTKRKKISHDDTYM